MGLSVKERRILELRHLLREQDGREPTDEQAARMLLERARDPSSAWHDAWDWDKDRAANAHWLSLARQYVVQYRPLVNVERPEPTVTKIAVREPEPKARNLPMRATVASRPNVAPKLDTSYRSLADIQRETRVLGELRKMRAQYGDIRRFVDVWDAIDALESSESPRSEATVVAGSGIGSSLRG